MVHASVQDAGVFGYRRFDGVGRGVFTDAPAANPVVIYEGARLIIGSAATPPIEVGAFVVQNGRITAIGAKGAVTAPAGAARVDLTGKTVMPAMVNTHIHFGYEQFLRPGTRSAMPPTTRRENLQDQFEREAFYGVGTVNDGGSASVPISLQFQLDQAARNYPPAAQYVFNPGVVPPNGGPDATLRMGTRPLHANYEVITSVEARAAVKDIAAKNITHLKIWMGDRGGSYPAMPHEVYEAVIDEAHKSTPPIRVHAHSTNQRDDKDALRAGVDQFIHIIGNAKMDDELVALIREKKPYWAPIIGSGDRSETLRRRTVCRADAAGEGRRGYSRQLQTECQCGHARRNDQGQPDDDRQFRRPRSCSGPTPASAPRTRSAGPITTSC